MRTKKIDRIAAEIFNGYSQLKEENKSLEYNSDESIKKFISDRLKYHGRNGIMFHASEFYKEVLYQTCWNDKSLLINYVFKNNSFRRQPTK